LKLSFFILSKRSRKKREGDYNLKTKKILILGAGAAGTIVANKLARDLRREIARDEVEITILDKSDMNINQAGFTFVPFGFYTPDDIRRPRRKLISPRVKAIFGEDGEVARVDLENREVTVKSGKKYFYDYLLIATGCTQDVESVPGLSKDFNTFYTSLEDTLRLKESLQALSKGKIVVLTIKMPIPCPGAPAKFTVLLDDYLRYVKRARENFDITFLWPIPTVGPPPYNSNITKAFEERKINDVREFKFSEIDAEKKEVVSADGERIKYDFLVTIPPHKGIKALYDSGITDENGWVPADKYTLQYKKSETEKHDEVYVAGDAGPLEILKTGVTAHYQAFTVAQNLIYDVLGTGDKVHYLGNVGCPYVGSTLTPDSRGKAFLAVWSYGLKPRPFVPTEAGWYFYRMYYYIYWDLTVKAII